MYVSSFRMRVFCAVIALVGVGQTPSTFSTTVASLRIRDAKHAIHTEERMRERRLSSNRSALEL